MSYSIDWRLVGEAFQGGLPPVIAVCVAYVAFQQWRTARDKLRLDLFDRRLSNYQSIAATVRAYLAAVRDLKFPNAESSEVSTQHDEFWSLYDSARFLFGPDVCDCLDDISERLINFKNIKAGLVMGEEEVRPIHLLDAEAEVQIGLSDLRNTVAKYVSLGHIAVRKLSVHEQVPRP
jgi:hypothetical protein